MATGVGWGLRCRKGNEIVAQRPETAMERERGQLGVEGRPENLSRSQSNRAIPEGSLSQGGLKEELWGHRVDMGGVSGMVLHELWLPP